MPQGLPHIPQQMASRNQSGGIMGLLQGLLGREGEPNLPEIQQVPMGNLVDAFNGAQGVDEDKRRQIQAIIEGRTADDAARGPQPVGPMTPGDSSANPLQKPDIFGLLNAANPGEVLGDAMQDARRRGGFSN